MEPEKKEPCKWRLPGLGFFGGVLTTVVVMALIALVVKAPKTHNVVENTASVASTGTVTTAAYAAKDEVEGLRLQVAELTKKLACCRDGGRPRARQQARTGRGSQPAAPRQMLASKEPIKSVEVRNNTEGLELLLSEMDRAGNFKRYLAHVDSSTGKLMTIKVGGGQVVGCLTNAIHIKVEVLKENGKVKYATTPQTFIFHGGLEDGMREKYVWSVTKKNRPDIKKVL